jgi:hypothetical protein
MGLATIAVDKTGIMRMDISRCMRDNLPIITCLRCGTVSKHQAVREQNMHSSNRALQVSEYLANYPIHINDVVLWLPGQDRNRPTTREQCSSHSGSNGQPCQ